jgi:hypothetical protein
MRYPIKNPLHVGAPQGVELHRNNKRGDLKGNAQNRKNFRKIFFDRNFLPKPVDYYRTHFSNIPVNLDRQWMNVLCCFHDDKNPSLSINLISGGFYCFGCGAKGGDVIAFHMQRYGVPFAAAVTFFGAWTYEQ